jgi:hypothetical protein
MLLTTGAAKLSDAGALGRRGPDVTSLASHHWRHITASWPPSTTRPVPWMKEASSEARKA